jgi:hypothetical protein
MSKVIWGILSTANIGIKRVIPAILSGERGVIAAIASRDAERARDVAARFGIARSYGSYQALLDDDEVLLLAFGWRQWPVLVRTEKVEGFAPHPDGIIRLQDVRFRP